MKYDITGYTHMVLLDDDIVGLFYDEWEAYDFIDEQPEHNFRFLVDDTDDYLVHPRSTQYAMTQAEVAEELGITQQTVAETEERAMAKLKDKFDGLTLEEALEVLR